MCLTCLFFLSFCSQFAKSKTADGYKLPASHRHAHSTNLLLHQRGAGTIPQLPDRGPEDYVQPGDVWQPAGQHCSFFALQDIYIYIYPHACKMYKWRLWLFDHLYHLILVQSSPTLVICGLSPLGWLSVLRHEHFHIHSCIYSLEPPL